MHPRSIRPATRIAAVAALLSATLIASAAVAAVQEEVHLTYPLSAGGRVSLENVNGDVEIEAWDRNEVEIRATKSAGDAELLAELEVEVDASADSVRIRTEYPNQRGSWFGDDHLEVEYTLHVPRGARLAEIELVNGTLDLVGIEGGSEVSLVNGDLRASELGGDLALETVNGRLEVELGSLASTRDVRLESVNGKVVLILPRSAGVDLRASTVHGSIRNDFGIEVEKDGLVGREMRGRVGSGDVRVELETVNGSIDVRGQ